MTLRPLRGELAEEGNGRGEKGNASLDVGTGLPRRRDRGRGGGHVKSTHLALADQTLLQGGYPILPLQGLNLRFIRYTGSPYCQS